MLAAPLSEPVLAIIPTVVVSTPFAFLIWLFPVASGTLAWWARRRLALLMVLSLNSTLYLLYAWFGGRLRAEVGLPVWALWGLLVLIALAGTAWSWLRQREPCQADPGGGRTEPILMALLSLAGLVGAGCWLLDGTWSLPPRRNLLVLCAVPWSGTLYALLKRGDGLRRPAAETVMLGTFALACVLATVSARPRGDSETPYSIVWTYELPQHGAIAATLLHDGDRLFVPIIRDGDPPSGVVCCLRADTGKIVWQFDDDGHMQHMISSPCLADGRLFIGEGMHANYVCKLYCLDAATGRKLWEIKSAGHIESSPCVADGRVYFGAGDDGLYCLDAATGTVCWHFTERVHIDSSPAAAGGRVYFGSGVSRTRKTTAAFCLDAVRGNVLWRTPADLPVWGSPVVEADAVYFGLGNGRLDHSAAPPERPAGALWCVEAATGRSRWRFDVPDSVFDRPQVTEDRVVFTARNGACYCLECQDGMQRWKLDLGSAAVTTPARSGDRLYVVATAGRLCCLDLDTGRKLWSLDLAVHTQTRPRLLSSAVVVTDSSGSRRIYLGTELRTAVSSSAVLYCFAIDRKLCHPASPQRQARTSRNAMKTVSLVLAWRCGLAG